MLADLASEDEGEASQLSFGPEYARLYEAKYADKDYRLECDKLLGLLDSQGVGRVGTILDVGCGAGGHAFELAKRGYVVHGVDRSPAMISRAIAKRESSNSPDFEVGDATDLHLEQQFDVVIMMFAVMSYFVSNEQLLGALRSVQRHLRPGGVFLADFWYGPGVLTDPPEARSSNLVVDGERTKTQVHPALDWAKDVCRLEYQISRDGMSETTSEVHEIRYFFLPELELALGIAGLTLVQTFDGSDWGRPLVGSCWTAGLMAKKAGNPAV